MKTLIAMFIAFSAPLCFAQSSNPIEAINASFRFETACLIEKYCTDLSTRADLDQVYLKNKASDQAILGADVTCESIQKRVAQAADVKIEDLEKVFIQYIITAASNMGLSTCFSYY